MTDLEDKIMLFLGFCMGVLCLAFAAAIIVATINGFN